MNNLLKALGLLLIGLLLTIISGGIWWKLWMDHNWVGTPKIIHSIFNLDGEATYKATMIEMMIIMAVIYFSSIFIYVLKKDN
ncbi:hypothetical protein [Thalassotalea ganghwensis]